MTELCIFHTNKPYIGGCEICKKVMCVDCIIVEIAKTKENQHKHVILDIKLFQEKFKHLFISPESIILEIKNTIEELNCTARDSLKMIQGFSSQKIFEYEKKLTRLRKFAITAFSTYKIQQNYYKKETYQLIKYIAFKQNDLSKQLQLLSRKLKTKHNIELLPIKEEIIPSFKSSIDLLRASIPKLVKNNDQEINRKNNISLIKLIKKFTVFFMHIKNIGIIDKNTALQTWVTNQLSSLKFESYPKYFESFIKNLLYSIKNFFPCIKDKMLISFYIKDLSENLIKTFNYNENDDCVSKIK